MSKGFKILSIGMMLLSLASCELQFNFKSNDKSNNSSEVNSDEPSITFVSSTNELIKGTTFQLEIEVNNSSDNAVIWESGNPKVLTVNDDGLITGVSVGLATIYVTLESDTSIDTSIDIRVIEEVTPTPSTSSTSISDKTTSSQTSNKPTTPSSTSSSTSSSSSSNTDSIENENPDPKKYVLNWHDEFDSNTLNTNYWNYQEGDGSVYGIPGWGNGELQYYSKNNVTVSNGKLIITAKKESMGGKSYTSARIRTSDKVAYTYGRIEAKMKLPAYSGLWPAFWMLPDTTDYGGWPNSGEIDIMEAKGRLPNESSAAIHFANSSNQHQYLTGTADYAHASSSRIDDWHVFAVEWDSTQLNFYVDDYCFFGAKNNQFAGVMGSNGQPFDKNFHILFNLAVGGMFDNYVTPEDSSLPASMEVDYVRWWGLK